jgi:F5/8 type C domain
VVDNVVMENNGIFSKETLTGKGLYNDHSKAIKDYPTPNIVAGGDGNVYVQANFGVIRNSKFVESYDGQGFLTGYEVAGDKSMMNGHKVGTYDAARDVTYYGIVMDMDSNRIYAPDGTTLKAGKDADPAANGVESYGKEWQIGKMDGGNFVKSDELVSESGGNSAKYLADGELSAMYDYHRGFSTIDLASSSVDLAFQVDLGAVTTLTAVRMYGVQNLSFDASVWNNAEYGYLLPKSFTVYTSEDGETWTQRKIRALSSEGGYVRGGVDKIIDFKPTTARATNDFVFADIEVNARYVRIVVDGANAVAGTSGVWQVEIGELQVISSFDTNVDYVYPETGRKGD